MKRIASLLLFLMAESMLWPQTEKTSTGQIATTVAVVSSVAQADQGNPPDVIDVSGVPDPAPQGVYRTERWAPASYVIPNLTPGRSYTVRHFLSSL